MPNSTVMELIKAVKSLHDDVLELKTDNTWIKRGLMGIYGLFGGCIIAVMAVWVTR